MLQVYYCKKCKTNVLEDAWNADKQVCNRCSARRHKYNAVRTTVDGISFHSKKEAAYYLVLKARERAGEIANLERQPHFDFIYNGILVETYIADFRYVDCATGNTVVVDVKGYREPVYRHKKRWFEVLFAPMKITEV